MRQSDLAARSGISASLVSLIERGHLDRISLRVLRRVGAALDIRVDLFARWRGGELDRLINAGHSALHESVARSFASLPDWDVTPEVSFAIYGERGVIDLVAWHARSRSLIIIELKTDLVDVQEAIGTLDRKRRLATRICQERGWPEPATVSSWLILADSSANRRRLARHASVLRLALPTDGRTMRAWLRNPGSAVAALSFLAYSTPRGAMSGPPARQRVRVAPTKAA